MIDLDKLRDKLRKAIDETTPEEWEKFFPKDTKPKGWISIEEHLPHMYGRDFLQGYTLYKVKDKDGNEFESGVADHNTWYYYAKEEGITHWWNE